MRHEASTRDRRRAAARRFLQLTAPALIMYLALGSFCHASSNPPQSILILEQSDVRGPFYYEIFSALRSSVKHNGKDAVTIYVENLDLTRFGGPSYEQSLQAHLHVKYRDRPIGVIVAVGVAALNTALRWRQSLWPDTPIVFAMVDEPTFARLKMPPDVTGGVIRLRLADMMTVARAVVPDLKRVVILGDPFEGQTVFGHFADEMPAATAGVEVIDMTGLPLKEVRHRVAVLPDQTAILYTSIYSGGEGAYIPPADALERVAEVANRPIVVPANTFIGRGGLGGYVMSASAIGAEAAHLAMRILNGESATSISPRTVDVVRPVFDWREMRRWNVSASSLPAGSEIRFREPGAWDRYRWQILTTGVVIVLQTSLIWALLFEHRKRATAEMETRKRMSELAHMNRYATAGELSAAIAHELNQPLGAILNNTETAELLIDSPSPNLDEIKEILADVKRDDQRASEVIQGLRRLLTKAPLAAEAFDLNDAVRDVKDLLAAQAKARNVDLDAALAQEPVRVQGDKVQIQQVLVNLVVNGMDAVADSSNSVRTIICRSAVRNGAAHISITDSGPGIPSDKVNEVFEPFFTTKTRGMGMGLSIVRRIIEAHGGKIWAENRAEGGAEFQLTLPIAKPD